MKKAHYKRILLKLSGEALCGDQEFGLNHKACQNIASRIAEVEKLGVQIGIVIGGGNIFRGKLAKEFGFDRTPADQIGMIATAINGVALAQSLSSFGCRTKIMSALPFGGVIGPYNWSEALELLDQSVVLIFVGGTGNPYFTTDTTAAMRASEIKAEVVLKATKVDGVYDKDPSLYPDAKQFKELSYARVLADKLDVMDATAVALCRENQIPIHVFNLFQAGSLINAVCHKEGGTLVSGE